MVKGLLSEFYTLLKEPVLCAIKQAVAINTTNNSKLIT